MKSRPSTALMARPSFSFSMLLLLIAALWLAGGASRADASGQIIVRVAAWATMCAAALFGAPSRLSEERPIVLLLGAAVLLAAMQLVPLPPALWQALPGRALASEAATISGQSQPWRPWAMVPGAAWNALSSLAIPVAILLLTTGSRPEERRLLPSIMLFLICVSAFLGLLQFSGKVFTNPFVNDTMGQVSATFANRNHFALFIAFGCAIAPAWTFLGGRRPGWRGPVTLGLLPIFILIILASGSRAGMLAGLVGLAAGLAMAWRPLRQELGRRPPWVGWALVGGLVAAIILLTALSIAADRAVSISRALTLDNGHDMRQRGLPTVIEMLRSYFPVGSGAGGFDPMFRMNEPFDLLKITYFNHAHNDYLEIVLDAGIAGLLVLICAIGWWLWKSFHAWRQVEVLPRLGSILLMLVLIASMFDYPARTPLVMATMVIAGIWLNGTRDLVRPALPVRG